MCLKRDLINDALKYWYDACPHDTVIWFYAAANDGLYLYEKKVIQYRHHSSNAGFEDTLGAGLKAETEKAKILSQLEQINRLMPMLNGVPDEESKRKTCKEIIKYLQLRYSFLDSKRIMDGIKVIKMKGNVGKRQVVFDWLLAYMT